ncbi:ParB/RepB/Spo0J family partition protein [Nitratireductor sp. CAU 1489]|uniref:ParB/RepB/Spo0J family partition protein n=1 Tax=Nitratireductor arenosus TaxID=2682096 RepID=A0A844QF33_9HYPH|nr:ParB/RepB/Spo0J family partition protein [Nitratireductor arenosus]MVA96630.1 ParB/RepB/Spo0J family partition protein [Nitratireductor arenosus]
MTEEQSRRRLGRGLAALIGDMDKPTAAQDAPTADRELPIEFLLANPRNPRRQFLEEELGDLSQSIREHGIVQPIVVRPAADGRYEIIAGERRWRAAQRAGLAKVPVMIRDVDDRVALELAIIENVQRADLNPVEEAAGYQQLVDEHQYTQADLARIIGKSRSHVANTLRLLKLPEVIRDMLVEGSLSAGHGRTLVTADDPTGLAKKIVEEGLSVRQAELLAQAPRAPETKSAKPYRAAPQKDADTEALEKLLSDVTGLTVSIHHRDNGGQIKIDYKTLEQLDEVCRRLQSH